MLWVVKHKIDQHFMSKTLITGRASHKLRFLVRHRNLEYQPKRAIPSIENVFAFLETGYIVHYKTK